MKNISAMFQERIHGQAPTLRMCIVAVTRIVVFALFSAFLGGCVTESTSLLRLCLSLYDRDECIEETRESAGLQNGEFLLKLHPEVPIANIQVSEADYERYLIDFTNTFQDITRVVYHYFADVFDFIFIAHTENFDIVWDKYPELWYGAVSSALSNNVRGLGEIPIFNDRALASGSAGQLQGIIHFTFLGGFINGPSLHEIMHRWGNYILPDDDGGLHWAYASIEGHIGGYSYDMLTNSCINVSITFECIQFDRQFDRFNLFPYAPFELYLMGLVPPAEVPDITVAINPVWTWTVSEQSFTVDRFETYSMERIIAENGPRIPDHTESQKHFRGIYVIVSTGNLTEAEWQSEGADIAQFANPAADDSPVYNFWEATGGRASFQLNDIASSLIREPSEPAPRLESFESSEGLEADMQVSSVEYLPDNIGLGATSSFALQGIGLPSGIQLEVGEYGNCQESSGESTFRTFECTWSQAGEANLSIRNAEGMPILPDIDITIQSNYTPTYSVAYTASNTIAPGNTVPVSIEGSNIPEIMELALFHPDSQRSGSCQESGQRSAERREFNCALPQRGELLVEIDTTEGRIIKRYQYIIRIPASAF